MPSLIDKKIAPPRSSSGLGAVGSAMASTVATRAVGTVSTGILAYGVRALEQALGLRFDPAPAYLFYVELSGIIVGLFTEVGGLEVERGTDKVEEGGVNHYVHYLPGRMKQSTITLKRGLSISRALWDWMQQGRYDYNVRRINFSIIQGAPGHNLAAVGLQQAPIDATGDVMSAYLSGLITGFGKVKHWDVENAYPKKWKASDLSTSSDKVVIETLEIVHHGMTLSYEVGTPMSITAAGAQAFGSFVGGVT
jgi:phage tail-like protein